MDLVENFIKESNRIEGIFREPTKDEVSEFHRFMELDKISISDLKQFVSIYQPNAVLRNKTGLDVMVGGHIPPRGGMKVVEELKSILDRANGQYDDAYVTHVRYEHLHPFTDGNGRSGRMLWAWQFRDLRLGFLHRFYYQTLDAKR